MPMGILLIFIKVQQLQIVLGVTQTLDVLIFFIWTSLKVGADFKIILTLVLQFIFA